MPIPAMYAVMFWGSGYSVWEDTRVPNALFDVLFACSFLLFRCAWGAHGQGEAAVASWASQVASEEGYEEGHVGEAMCLQTTGTDCIVKVPKAVSWGCRHVCGQGRCACAPLSPRLADWLASWLVLAMCCCVGCVWGFNCSRCCGLVL